MEIGKEIYKIVGGNAGISEKSGKPYAILDIKNKFKVVQVFLQDTDEDTRSIIDKFDDVMGKDITLTYSISDETLDELRDI